MNTELEFQFLTQRFLICSAFVIIWTLSTRVRGTGLLLGYWLHFLQNYGVAGIMNSLAWTQSELALIPLGSDLACFRASRETLAARKERILAGGPLQVLIVSTWSMQKGAPYLIQTARALGSLAQCRFVGAIGQDARHLLPEARTVMEFCPRVPQHELPRHYGWGDVFLFPTLQDGYAVVLAQAQAAGLPLLATPNCAAPELVSEGRTGWIRPIRDATAYTEQLRWCAAHREQLAAMVDAVAASHAPRDWRIVAQDFLAAATADIARVNSRTAAGNLR